MEGVIIRRQEEAGFRPLPDDIIAFRAIGYAKHLLNLGIEPKDFDYIYELATSIYNATPPEGPFGIDHLIQAARGFKESKKEFVVYKRPDRKAMVSCTTCQGSKIEFIYNKGKVVGLAKDEKGKVKSCNDCKEI